MANIGYQANNFYQATSTSVITPVAAISGESSQKVGHLEKARGHDGRKPDRSKLNSEIATPVATNTYIRRLFIGSL